MGPTVNNHFHNFPGSGPGPALWPGKLHGVWLVYAPVLVLAVAHITLLAHGLPGRRGPGHQQTHYHFHCNPHGWPPPTYPAPPLPKQVGLVITFVLIWCCFVPRQC